ncbi:RNA-directed RNA polymerase [ssRNA phage SRR5466727_3]|uniref:RNA-directed RNA polymerase n=1 Tax=ssRNA phage SRR5466727_3 TaxID=2786432 RepID=A0A8S5L452_9VIRU|nr:RNA-directed RNA polymerase [ssRNA phage SRR5466727_3]DAD52449.1 TPA_asm: RNA-directed RNA polymerase [ssRNA phage SRR5466727_3]
MKNHELVNRLRSVSAAESNSALEDVFFELCASIDSPKSLAAWLLFKNDEHDQFVELSCDPDQYSTAFKYADDALVTSFLSKFPYLNLSVDPEEAARVKFLEFEELCKSTNKRFSELSLDPSKWGSYEGAIFHRARRIIADVLGRPNLNEIARGFGWGPGATTVATGSSTTAYDKFQDKLEVTSNCLVMGHCCINSIPSWVNCQLMTDEFPSSYVSLIRDSMVVIRGNKIVFVPKNAKIRRTIAIEPPVNSYVQKGFGTVMRTRLRSVGCDLNDQTLNQRLAREGSLTGKLATLDLKGASDTIASAVVKALLPFKWWVLLDMARSKQGLLDGTWLHYEKFSSMGNGFTFELESLIFWALCRAVLDQDYDSTDDVFNVYGDDIIVPVRVYDKVASILNHFGFILNEKKSFSSGHFRESCGKDFFQGYDVRPIFLKERISNVESIYKLANGIRRYSHRRNLNYGCDVRLRSAWTGLVARLHPDFRALRVPDGKGDCGIVVNFDEASPSRVNQVKNPGHEGWSFQCLQRLPLRKPMSDRHGCYATALSASGSEEPLLGMISPRGRTYPKIARGRTVEWYDLGPWC